MTPSTSRPTAPTPSPGAPSDGWVKVAEPGELDAPTARLHVRVGGRYISVLRYKGQIYCLDSVCHHAGGPLALGDIEELDGVTGPDGSAVACLVCPWHFYHVSIADGEKFYQAAQPGEDGKLHAGRWKSVGARQRVHDVEQRDDGVYVRLRLDGALASDEYACKAECGTRVKTGSLRLSSVERDGSRSPGRSASPRRSTPPASPRAVLYLEGEDIWPEDLTADNLPRRSHASGRWRGNGNGNGGA
jgi:nitrite reductase/ring-hydroxylating ferredoxin subunit